MWENNPNSAPYAWLGFCEVSDTFVHATLNLSCGDEEHLVGSLSLEGGWQLNHTMAARAVIKFPECHQWRSHHQVKLTSDRYLKSMVPSRFLEFKMIVPSSGICLG